MAKKNAVFQLDAGEKTFSNAPLPVMEVVDPGGKDAYLWIGNGETPQFCFATLTNRASLRRLANLLKPFADAQ